MDAGFPGAPGWLDAPHTFTKVIHHASGLEAHLPSGFGVNGKWHLMENESTSRAYFLDPDGEYQPVNLATLKDYRKETWGTGCSDSVPRRSKPRGQAGTFLLAASGPALAGCL